MDDFATGYALGSDSGNNGGGSFLNGDGIWTILLFAMIFGWNEYSRADVVQTIALILGPCLGAYWTD